MTLGGRPRRDDGAIILVFAFVLVFLMILVAFAVDLGQGRFSRRDDQQAVDLASLSAGYYLAGNGGGATPQNRPRDACEAAFNSILTNVKGFTPTISASGACSGFPATNASCTSATSVTTTGPVVGGNYTLSISWPVNDATIADSRFAGGSTTNDGARCERMRIQIDKVDQTRFARVIGINTVSTSASAVVRGAPGLTSEGVAALLLLEREGCSALSTSGQGRVIVKTTGSGAAARPGVIQGDSAGSTSFGASALKCTTNDNSNGYVIYGTQAPQSLGGGPSIIAEATPSGSPGIIATYAQTVGGRAACCRPDGLSVEPTGSDITSRTPADNRFNPTTRPAIEDLHAATWSAAVTNGSTVTGTTVTDCSPDDAATTFTPAVGENTITVNCPGGFQVDNNKTVVFAGADTVKFIGGIEVKGGGVLDVQTASTVTLARATESGSARLDVKGTASFNRVRDFQIGGTPASCTSGNCQAINVTGKLLVNTGALNTTTCALGPGSDPASTATNWTALATTGGQIAISGSVTFCQTMVYVGRSTSSYSPQQRVSGGINCSVDKPCPLLETADSRDRFNLNGGNGSVVLWSAPNQLTGSPTATNPFEGLSLWTEATGLSEIKGRGALTTTGVYFLPNALFDFNGRASATNPFNAQFFARTLLFSGQGDLNLSPDPRDSVPTPIPGSYSVIR